MAINGDIDFEPTCFTIHPNICAKFSVGMQACVSKKGDYEKAQIRKY